METKVINFRKIDLAKEISTKKDTLCLYQEK